MASPVMAKCDICKAELEPDVLRFCSEACRNVFMERLKQGTRSSTGRTAARRRRKRGR